MMVSRFPAQLSDLEIHTDGHQSLQVLYAEKERDLEQGVVDNDRTAVSSNNSVEKNFTEHID